VSGGLSTDEENQPEPRTADNVPALLWFVVLAFWIFCIALGYQAYKATPPSSLPKFQGIDGPRKACSAKDPAGWGLQFFAGYLKPSANQEKWEGHATWKEYMKAYHPMYFCYAGSELSQWSRTAQVVFGLCLTLALALAFSTVQLPAGVVYASCSKECIPGSCSTSTNLTTQSDGYGFELKIDWFLGIVQALIIQCCDKAAKPCLICATQKGKAAEANPCVIIAGLAVLGAVYAYSRSSEDSLSQQDSETETDNTINTMLSIIVASQIYSWLVKDLLFNSFLFYCSSTYLQPHVGTPCSSVSNSSAANPTPQELADRIGWAQELVVNNPIQASV
jgi:hypothetical protein